MPGIISLYTVWFPASSALFPDVANLPVRVVYDGESALGFPSPGQQGIDIEKKIDPIPRPNAF